MRPLRILHLSEFFHPVIGGAEQVVLRLASGMAVRGHQVTVFTSDSSRIGRLTTRSEQVQGVEVLRFPTWFRLSRFAAFWPGFCTEAKTRTFDIIHAHSYRHPHCDLASLPFVRRGAKLVIQPHWAAYPRSLAGHTLTSIYDVLLGKRLFRACDLALAITPLEVQWLRTMGARTIEVLPNGIPSDYLGAQDGCDFRKKYGIGEFLLASIGRIDESKGFQFVIEALRKIQGVRYVIVGAPGPFYPRLVSMIKTYHLEKTVTLLGEVSEQEKLQILDASDAFIQPSIFEAFGVSTLEALARGKPCLGSKAGGLPWLLEGCGILFSPGDIEGIAQCLRRVKDDPGLRERLAVAGQAKASNLTWDKIIPRYEQILLQLTKQGGSSQDPRAKILPRN